MPVALITKAGVVKAVDDVSFALDRGEVLGHRHRPAQTLLDALAQAVGGIGLAVHEVDLTRRPAGSAQPRQELVGIGMRRPGVDILDPRPHRMPLAVDAHLAGARHQMGAPGAAGLVADEDDAVARVRRQRLQVMQHPPAGGHAAGGDDHRGHAQAGQRTGLVGGVDQPGHRTHRPALGHAQPVQGAVAAIERRGIDRHG
jgi:hypothetical protein